MDLDNVMTVMILIRSLVVLYLLLSSSSFLFQFINQPLPCSNMTVFSEAGSFLQEIIECIAIAPHRLPISFIHSYYRLVVLRIAIGRGRGLEEMMELRRRRRGFIRQHDGGGWMLNLIIIMVLIIIHPDAAAATGGGYGAPPPPPPSQYYHPSSSDYPYQPPPPPPPPPPPASLGTYILTSAEVLSSSLLLLLLHPHRLFLYL